MPVVTDSKQAS